MRYLITKEKIVYTLAVTLLCIIILAVTGVFTSTVSVTSISGEIYDNGMSIVQIKTVTSIVLSFWLGLLTPVVLFKAK
jgi:Ni,Fe-hydrogenase I cytochrome b subunit